MLEFLKNIVWLNIKKLKQNVFWRLLFVAVNLVLFLPALIVKPATSLIPAGAYPYVVLLVTLSNTLFLYVKITFDIASVSLLRSLGASRSFIIVNNITEVLLLFFISIIVFAIIVIFFGVSGRLFLISLAEMVYIVLASYLFSSISIYQAEKIDKAS